MIQFKENNWIDGRIDRRKDRWKDGGRTDPILQEPSDYRRGSKKK